MQASRAAAVHHPDAFSASGLALRRLSGITASVRPCSCCSQYLLRQQQQQQQSRCHELQQLQPRSNGCTVSPSLGSHSSGRRRLVITASGAAGGMGGHGGGRGEPVSEQRGSELCGYCTHAIKTCDAWQHCIAAVDALRGHVHTAHNNSNKHFCGRRPYTCVRVC